MRTVEFVSLEEGPDARLGSVTMNARIISQCASRIRKPPGDGVVDKAFARRDACGPRKHANAPLSLGLAAAGVILSLVFSASSCSHGDKGKQPAPFAAPAVAIPETEEPIVALVNLSDGGGPAPLFVLYRNGLVISGDFDRRPVSAVLGAEQVRQIYSSLPLDSLVSSDKQKFSPGPGAGVSLFLFIRKPDGSHLRVGSYEVTPKPEWPSNLRPPEPVTKTLESLAHYLIEGATPWSPPEIEVEFNAQPPDPSDRAWWPATWPQPALKPTGNFTVPVMRLPASYEEQVRMNSHTSYGLRLAHGSYSVSIRYPFPREEAIAAELKQCCSDF